MASIFERDTQGVAIPYMNVYTATLKPNMIDTHRNLAPEFYMEKYLSMHVQYVQGLKIILSNAVCV